MVAGISMITLKHAQNRELVLCTDVVYSANVEWSKRKVRHLDHGRFDLYIHVAKLSN